MDQNRPARPPFLKQTPLVAMSISQVLGDTSAMIALGSVKIHKPHDARRETYGRYGLELSS